MKYDYLVVGSGCSDQYLLTDRQRKKRKELSGN